MQKRFGKLVLDTATAEFLGWSIEAGRVVYAAYLQQNVLFATRSCRTAARTCSRFVRAGVRDMAGHIRHMCTHLTPEAYGRHIRGTYLERAFGRGLSVAA